MSKQRLIILALVIVVCSIAVAQEKRQPGLLKMLGADEKTTVEVYLSSEHVPSGLKAGAKVDLKRVDNKTVIPSGKVSYVTTIITPDIEVASITLVEKPKSPEQAVKVDLRVTKAQAAKIERAKAQIVTQSETASDGSITTVKKPVTSRLEPTK